MEKTPALRSETYQKVVEFTENEYTDLITLNKAFEVISFDIRFDLDILAEPYIKANILPVFVDSIKRIVYKDES
mgnify:CR=1 FL=1